MLSSLLHDALMVNSNKSEAFAFNFVAPHIGVAVLVTLNSIFNLQSGHYSCWQLQVFSFLPWIYNANQILWLTTLLTEIQKSGPPVFTVIADQYRIKKTKVVYELVVTFTGRRAQIFWRLGWRLPKSSCCLNSSSSTRCLS